jgi:hypothetical protein
MDSFVQLLASCAAILGGLLADKYGYRYSFHITGLICGGAALARFPLLKLIPEYHEKNRI